MNIVDHTSILLLLQFQISNVAFENNSRTTVHFCVPHELLVLAAENRFIDLLLCRLVDPMWCRFANLMWC